MMAVIMRSEKERDVLADDSSLTRRAAGRVPAGDRCSAVYPGRQLRTSSFGEACPVDCIVVEGSAYYAEMEPDDEKERHHKLFASRCTENCKRSSRKALLWHRE